MARAISICERSRALCGATVLTETMDHAQYPGCAAGTNSKRCRSDAKKASTDVKDRSDGARQYQALSITQQLTGVKALPGFLACAANQGAILEQKYGEGVEEEVRSADGRMSG
jgi:hypothetical protein